MKKSMYMGFVVLLLAVSLGALVVACGARRKELDGPSTLDGQALVEERCTKCHDLTRVKAAKKSEEGWKVTVERMVRKGATLEKAEQEAAIEYLTETYPE